MPTPRTSNPPGRPKCEGITPRGRDLLRAAVRFARTHGRLPTYRELAKLLGVRSQAGICQHMERLASLGYVVHDSYGDRYQIKGLSMELELSSEGMKLRRAIGVV